MDSQRHKQEHRRFPSLNHIGLALIVWLLIACAGPPEPEPAPLQPPSVRFLQAPQRLCRDATQLRLDVQTSGPDLQNPTASWVLRSAEGDETLNNGRWAMESGELYVPFPDGNPLPPGDYKVHLQWQGETLISQPFTVQAQGPRIEDMEISLVPNGEASAPLRPEIRHFYVQYAYEGACPGAPYWLTVTHLEEDRAACTQNGTVPGKSGTGAIPCYQRGGEPFEVGSYEAVLTLMDDAKESHRFEIRQPVPTPTPTPTATPEPLSPTCGALFTAAGITPDGEPFLPLTFFDWYTQAVYVGTRCENLTSGTTWESRWYWEGEEVRTEAGRWEGEPAGVIWDSLTGTAEAPFLPPGAYTLTLEIGATEPLTAEMEVLSYPTEEETP